MCDCVMFNFIETTAGKCLGTNRFSTFVPARANELIYKQFAPSGGMAIFNNVEHSQAYFNLVSIVLQLYPTAE